MTLRQEDVAAGGFLVMMTDDDELDIIMHAHLAAILDTSTRYQCQMPS